MSLHEFGIRRGRAVLQVIGMVIAAGLALVGCEGWLVVLSVAR